MKLYELSTDLVKLRDLEEVDSKEIISIIETEISKEGKGIIQVIKSIESDVDVIKNEIDRLTKIKKVKENNIKKLRESTKYCMERMDMKKIETPLGNLSIRKGTSVLKIVDEDKLPDKYLEIIQTYKINKDMIKSDLKEGIQIEGAYMTEPGTTLVIK